jgi:hypothetical protein
MCYGCLRLQYCLFPPLTGRRPLYRPCHDLCWYGRGVVGLSDGMRAAGYCGHAHQTCSYANTSLNTVHDVMWCFLLVIGKDQLGWLVGIDVIDDVSGPYPKYGDWIGEGGGEWSCHVGMGLPTPLLKSGLWESWRLTVEESTSDGLRSSDFTKWSQHCTLPILVLSNQDPKHTVDLKFILKFQTL